MDSQDNNYFTDAVLISAFTASVYIISYSYEIGYASFFSIPKELVSSSPTMFLKAGAAIVSVLLPIYFIIQGLWPLLPRTNDPLSITIREFLFKSIVACVLMYPSLLNGEYIGFLLMLLGFFLFFDFIFPLLSQRSQPTYKQKLEAQLNTEFNTYNYTLMGAIRNRMGNVPALFFIITMLFSFFSHSLGEQNAKHKREFFKLDSLENDVIIAEYGDLLVIKKYDLKSKQFSKQIKILKISDNAAITMIPIII